MKKRYGRGWRGGRYQRRFCERVRQLIYFFYLYFLRLGILDGWNGFLFHFLQAFWFRLIVDERLEELRRS